MANVTFDFDAADGVGMPDVGTHNTPLEYSYKYSWGASSSGGSSVKVAFLGTGFTYDDNGNPSGGTVNQMTLDVGGGTVDMTITGLSFNLSELSEFGYNAIQMNNIIWHTVLAGNDFIDFSSVMPTADPSSGTAFAGDGDGVGPEAVLDSGNDRIIGQMSTGTISGDLFTIGQGGTLHGGDDTITMSAGSNGVLYGDATNVNGVVAGGNDTISAGAGVIKTSGDISFVTYGGSLLGGDDTISLAAAGTAIGDVEDSNGGVVVGGNDTITGSKGADVLYGDILKAVYHDYIRPGDDRVHGNGGDDQIYGDWQNLAVGVTVKGIGNDMLYGDAGNDTIYGNFGNDKIYGGTGADILDGGDGKDTLAGGSGADTFIFSSILKSANVDTITDFSHADDTFEIDNAVFLGLSKGNLAAGAFKLIGGATSTVGVDSSDRILYDKAHGDLYFDRDGSGGKYDRVLFAHVADKTALDHADFHIV